MRPPRMPPPRTQNTVPWPWSVPRLPFSRKVRPNSLMTTTTVSCHAGPCSSAKAASPRPSSSSRVARKPLAPPSPTCVSQPPTSTKPTLNCSFMSFATRRASASKPRALGGLAELDGVLRLEMAPAQVLGARERYESRLPVLVQPVDGIAERRMQAPFGSKRQDAFPRDRDVGTRLVIEAARDGDEDVG